MHILQVLRKPSFLHMGGVWSIRGFAPDPDPDPDPRVWG